MLSLVGRRGGVRAMATILLVERDTRIRKSLREVFAASQRFTKILDAESEPQTIQEAEHLHPCLVILGATGCSDGLRPFVHRLREITPDVPVFMLTDAYDAKTERQALRCGITAVFSRSDGASSLVANALAVCGG